MNFTMNNLDVTIETDPNISIKKKVTIQVDGLTECEGPLVRKIVAHVCRYIVGEGFVEDGVYIKFFVKTQ